MKNRLGLLLLAVLALCPPALASSGDSGEGVHPAVLSATMPAAEQCALAQAIGASAAALGIEPDPLPANHCNAQQFCPNDCFISCTGHVSCTVQMTSVTCDGVVTSCPYPGCTPPVNCADKCCWCECKAAGSTGCFRCCTDF